MKESDLTGRAREYFEDWRKLGLSESAALEEVERSGIAVEQDLTTLFERMGMSQEGARFSAQGRDGGAAGHPFDQMVRFFEGTGLSHEAAKTAAIGPGCTEAEARRELGEGAKARIAAAAPTDDISRGKAAFSEAVKAAAHYFSCTPEEALTRVERDVVDRHGSKPLKERIRHLRSYARIYGSGLSLKESVALREATGGRPRKMDRFAWAAGDLEEVAEDTDEAEELAEANTATVVELSEVLGRLCTGGEK